MNVELEVKLSEDARLLLKNIGSVSEKDFINWFKEKGFVLGSGDVMAFLKEKSGGK